MQRLSLLLALVATALAGYCTWVIASRPAPRPDGDLAALEARVASLERLLGGGSQDAPLTEEVIARWRRIEDEVRRRRADEQQGERFRRDIARSKAVLTPEQMEIVAKLASTHSQRLRDNYAAAAKSSPLDREAASARRHALIAEFEAQVRAAVPAVEADKLIETLRATNRGFYGGTSSGGVGGMD